MVTKCSAIARSGSRCNSPALPASTFCYLHDPTAEGRRREAARKGGKARANAARARKQIPEALTPDELAGWLSLLFTQVMTGQIEPRVATAAATVAKTLMDVRQASELEERLAALETQAAGMDTRWRA